MYRRRVLSNTDAGDGDGLRSTVRDHQDQNRPSMKNSVHKTVAAAKHTSHTTKPAPSRYKKQAGDRQAAGGHGSRQVTGWVTAGIVLQQAGKHYQRDEPRRTHEGLDGMRHVGHDQAQD